MTRSGRLRSYNSAINNLFTRLNSNNKNGKEARKEFYARLGLKKLQEKQFVKNLKAGKSFSYKEVRHFFKQVKKDRMIKLRKDWLDSKKSGNKSSFKEFIRANPEPDWEAIQELFNSPK